MATCVDDGSATANSRVWRFMLDGFPIIRPWENRAMLTTADLDQRHGKVSRIMLDGASVTTYHYVVYEDYPYTRGATAAAARRHRS